MRVVLRILALLLALPLILGGLGCLQLHLQGAEGLNELHDSFVKEFRKLQSEQGKPAAETAEVVEAVGELRDALAGALPVVAGVLGVPGSLLLLFALWPSGGKKAKAAKRPPGPAKAKAKGKAKAKRSAEPEVSLVQEEKPLSKREVKKAIKTAAQLESQRGPEAAGDYLLGSGLRDQAIDYFLKIDMLERAAEIRHDQNRFEESADLYEKAQRPESAGAIYAQLERFEDAARCYLAADKRSVAGEMFERAGNHDQAARCYRDIGFNRHAAQAFLQAGKELDAARCLVETFNEEGGEQAMSSPQKVKELRPIALKAAELFVKLDRLEEAEGVLVRCGAFKQAAQVAMKGGSFERAGALFQKIGRGDLAAQALERAGDTSGAARARGEFLAEKGEDAAAAEQLRAAGEHQQAADLLRKLERFDEAGECYSAAHDYGAAAEMYRTANTHDRACDAFEKCGDLHQAAEQAALAGDMERYAGLLERCGELYEAASAYKEQGNPDQAIRLLQSIEPDDPRYREACAMLGRLFQAKGMHSLSVNKFEQAAGEDTVSRATVDAHYELARALEQRGAPDRAAEIYERILSFDYHYRDVEQCIERAKQAARGGGPAVDSTDSSLPKGRGRYQLIRELGRGGMGVVYLARDSVLEREVAYKVLPEGLRGNPNALRKFLREAKAAAQLNHPHIVTVYDAGESEHGFYLAMEYVDGTTLKDLLQKRGAISPGGVLYVLRQMADALAYAHSKKVVHRDIKTANTMWTQAKQVKIMDFGLAKLMEEVRNATTLVSGTPFYMSPEQTLGRNVDHRTDLYSLGVTIFELATGQLPFRKGNVPYHHVHTPPPDPRELNAELPDAVAALILKCLEKDPEARFANAGEILEVLDRLGAKS